MTKEEALKLYAKSVRDWRALGLHIPGNEHTDRYRKDIVKWYKRYPNMKSVVSKALGV